MTTAVEPVAFTLDDVVAKVREVAAERPDFVYDDEDREGCYYRHGDSPGCIVGQALDRLGFTVPGDWEGTHSSEVLTRLFHLGPDEPTPASVAWIRQVQIVQDDGAPWGTAVQRADEVVRL